MQNLEQVIGGTLMRILAFILSLLALPALAQVDLYISPQRIETADDITREEWYGMVKGKTVVYRIGDMIWAHETYDPRTNKVYIAMADGNCMEGIWTHLGNEFCFAWDDRDFVCFRHARSEGEILIIPMHDGQADGDTQVVKSITNTGLPCGPELLG